MVNFVAAMVVAVMVKACGRHGLWTSWFVAVMVNFVAVMVVAVMVMVCGRHGCGRHGHG